jgi:guanine nucleotide-binding protein subunit alpha
MSSKVDPEDKEALKTNANIEKQIRSDKKTFDRTVKILLLGTPYRWSFSVVGMLT